MDRQGGYSSIGILRPLNSILVALALVVGLNAAQAAPPEPYPYLVKDINTVGFGSCTYPWTLAAVNGTLFFRADDGTSGSELWKSDGTEAGTVRVKDIYPGGGDSNPSELTNVNGTLFFRADDGSRGDELWRSNGTEAGTVQVKDIRPGSKGSGVSELTAVDGTLFFSAADGNHGRELWALIVLPYRVHLPLVLR